MNKSLLHVAICIGATMPLAGCIDNNYDLSDIDTTSEIKINDLTLPVNLDVITLDDIITVEEGDQIKKVTLNGKTFYAVEETGDYHSDPVKINEFTAAAETLTPTTATFSLLPSSSRRKAASLSMRYSLAQPVVKKLNYTATGIDDAIHSVESIKIKDTTLDILLSLRNASSFESATLTGIELQLPKGLTVKSTVPSGASYNSTSGVLTVPSLTLNNGIGSIKVTATAIDLQANNIQIDYPSHSLDFNSSFNLNKANLDLTSNLTSAPSSVSFDIDYTIGDLNATHLNGMIQYSLDGTGLNIDPILLNDLPDFLTDKRTNLILANPQIYLNITNPVGDAGLSYHSGMQIIAKRPGLADTDITLNSFEVGHSEADGPYNYCLSPEVPENIPGEYASGIQHVEFASLSNLLSGQGLPEKLDLKLLNPEIYLQHATNFELGRSLPGMKGNYRFLAPLALRGDSESGSIIVYSEKKTGWFDGDLSDLTINHMEISALATSQIPFNATLTGNPIDSEGNLIYYTDAEGNRVAATISGATIPAGATDYPLTIKIDGVITNLDGISFEAIVRPNGSNEALSPNQTLTLKNTRVKVSGKYVTEF